MVKYINSENLLEAKINRLKLSYFGHTSLEKTLMPGERRKERKE